MASQQFQPTLINRFIAGLQTQGRSPLVTPYTVVGINAIPRNDALITGSNMELTVNQTIARSPGFPTFCPFSFGSSEWPLGFYSWRKNDGALVERLVETSQLVSLHPRLTLVESAVQEIKASLQELKLLPKIASQLEAMQEGFRQMVPRAEHEGRWKANDERFSALEQDVRNLKG